MSGILSRIRITSAGAGTGKTEYLSKLLEDRIKSGKASPERIVAVTFTNRAATELKERVRSKLFGAGLNREALMMEGALIGTVNAVCSRLVQRSAFELGLSPEMTVIDEAKSEEMLLRAIGSTQEDDKVETLLEIAGRTRIEWGDKLRQIVNSALSYDIQPDQFQAFARQSIDSLMELFPETVMEKTEKKLIQAGEMFFKQLEEIQDETKGTRAVADELQKCLEILRADKELTWSEWANLARLSPCKKSAESFEPVRIAASYHTRNPRFRQDLQELISILFEMAEKALTNYQEEKATQGALDFRDQELLALRLLSNPETRRRLSGSLDLVLVDEFQDTSPIQLAVFLRLAELAAESVWVGDRKQAIYAFRGTDPQLMEAAVDEITRAGKTETLSCCYRSRPELVNLYTSIFTRSLKKQGFSAESILLKPGRDKVTLPPPVEMWWLDTKNKGEDYLALADCLQKFLASEPEVCGMDEKLRKATPGDIAILCRTNAECSEIAMALKSAGIPACIPESGLCATLESMVICAGLRLWADSHDTLAAAELCRLLDYAGKEDQLLKDLLENPDGASLMQNPIVSKIAEDSRVSKITGVLPVFDRVMELLDIRKLCLEWGDTDRRLANLDALRALAVAYVGEFSSSGNGVLVPGFIQYLTELQQSGEDEKPLIAGADLLTVSTRHKAKGLEWRVVVLYDSAHQNKFPGLGVKVENKGKFDFSDPLAGHWIRYWDSPYGDLKTTRFHEKVAEHSFNLEANERKEAEELRVLYVAFTRARDYLILAARPGKLNKGLFGQLLDSDGQPLISEPVAGKVCWAGCTVEVTERTGAEPEFVETKRDPGVDYKKPGQKEFPAAFVQPSLLEGEPAEIVETLKLGEPIVLPEDAKPDLCGKIFHAFFAVDSTGITDDLRSKIAADLIRNHNLDKAVLPEQITKAAQHLREWICKSFADAIKHTEMPLACRLETGSILRGVADLILETEAGFVIIDHKVISGDAKNLTGKICSFGPQLAAYKQTIQAATGKKVLSMWIHLPLAGLMYKVETALHQAAPSSC
ncbi:MAG: UvrD-helicase domain-containing protein [Candidatus Wallbacteria bacterium]|nr:UvrD-helicase domain-containing protein [Candidatus Wallbacteria bacterium]